MERQEGEGEEALGNAGEDDATDMAIREGVRALKESTTMRRVTAIAKRKTLWAANRRGKRHDNQEGFNTSRVAETKAKSK